MPDPSKPIEAQEDVVLLAMCVFGEARGQSRAAKIGVASAVRNRVALAPKFGRGWSGVILKRWAFSSFNAADPNRKKLMAPLRWEKPEVWAACWDAARAVYERAVADITDGATHYYDDSIAAPSWARYYVPTVKLGRLNFYRWTPEGDRQAAMDRQAAKRAQGVAA